MTASQFENLDAYTFITKHLVQSTKNDALPIVCVKPDNPKQGGWPPTPLTEDTLLPENANLYICISSCNKLFDPSSKVHGTYRATIECASQTHMFMLDDITDLETLPLEPTWVIETSPNNFQILYVLEEPLDDIPLANQITKLLPAKANADENAKNCVRWARLPGGRNNKPEYLDNNGDGFPVRIHTANPDLLYEIQHITSAFQLVLDEYTSGNPNKKLPSNAIRTQNTPNDAPIIESAPTGWPRHLSALLSIDANCDYNTWFGAMVAMHPWEEQGFIAFEEWSRTSDNPEHQKITKHELRNKWESVSNHTIGWPWLQSTAINHGWNYNEYSRNQLQVINDKLDEIRTEDDINALMDEIQESYFTASDLTAICQSLKLTYQVRLNIDHRMSTIRKKITEGTRIDPEAETWTYPLTDSGNLERFESLYGDELWYVPETKQFIHWYDNRWNHVREIQHLIINTINQIPYLEKRPLTGQEKKQLFNWCKQSQSNTHIRALETLVKKHTPMEKEISELNTHTTLIGTPTSICNLETGLAATNTPDHLITMHTRVDLMPDATCPRWDRFILEIMNYDKELASFLQRLAGYCLHGGNPEQLFIILEGHGANGKTTFVNVLQHVLGEYAATAGADTLTRPAFNKSGSSAAPDIVRLYRKRLVICNEWNEGTYINESLIKVLSGGGDEISVRALYSNRTIDYIPEFTIMLATNHRPNIAGMDYGLWRRLLIIPFEVNFTDAEHIAQREPHLEQYLRENESAGILNWLVQGYYQWKEQGIGTSVETGVPEKLIKIKKEFHDDMDTIGQFLKERTHNKIQHEITITDKIKSSDIYTAYKHWINENGYKPKGSKAFSHHLTSKGFKTVRIGTVRGFEGIRLRTLAELMVPEDTHGEEDDRVRSISLQ